MDIILCHAMCLIQGFHAPWKVLETPGPGKSWKITLVLESSGKISLKITHFIGLNGKQAAIVYHPVCVDCCLLRYCVQEFRKFFLFAFLV